MPFLDASLTLSFSKSGINAIKKALSKEASNEIFKQLKKNEIRISDYIRHIVKTNLTNSPEVQNIMDSNGKLRVELGVKDGDANILQVIAEIVDKTQIRMYKKNSIIEIEVYIDADYQHFYSNAYSSYVTESGVKIEWLSWLLEAGNQDIIFGYRIRYGVGVGRAGDVIMTPSKTANWRVPPEFSGVADDNFITRSFENVDSKLLKFIEGILI